ncbi:unnamed protein product [Cunninghamella blakesleeana]
MNYTNIKPPTLQTLENKIDTLESTIKNMNINDNKNINKNNTSSMNKMMTTITSDLPPTPSISSSSHRSSTLPQQQQQPLSPITSSSSIKGGGLTSSASSISSSYSHSIHTTTSASNMAPASYQKKLSTKYVHQSVYTSLQNAQLNTTLPEDWSVEQVGIWLGLMGFSDMTDNFEKQEITGDILLELTVDSLKELNVSTFGKRFKIVNAIKVLADENIKRKESPSISSLENQSNHTHLNQPTLSPTMSLTPSMTPPSSNTTTMTSNHTDPYMDDDLISDYSSIIKKSLQSSPTSPRLSTTSLTTKIKPTSSNSSSLLPSSSSNPISLNYNPLNPSDPSYHNNHNNHNNNSNINIHQQQHTQPLNNNYHSSSDFIQRSATPLNRSLSTSSYLHNNMNYPKSSLTHSQSLNKSNTMYNISSPIDQPQHRISVDQIGRSSMSSLNSNSTKSRYNFVRNSFLNGNKNQNVLSSSRMSMDGITQRLNKENSLPDMEGWLYKQGDKYKTWNKRWFVLKEANFFYFKSPKDTRMKGLINLHGYQILADENIYPGKYCFKLQHEKERTFYFYTDTESSLKAWMNKLLKSTITRDYSAPVMSSNNIPTVSLDVARRMKPRPPSTIFGKDFDPERPLSPNSQYDSRPFSLTYSEQPQPIMRMSMSDDTHHLYPNNNNQTQESGLIDEDELLLQQRQQRRPSSSFQHHLQQQQSFSLSSSPPPPISSPPASPPPSSPPPPPPSQLLTSSSSISSSILSQSQPPQPVPSTSSSSTITDHNKKMKITSMIYFNDEDEDLIDPLQRPSTQLSFHTTTTMNDRYDLSSNKIDLSTFQSHDTSSSPSSPSSSLLQQQQQQQQRKDSFHIIHDRIDELENENDDDDEDEDDEKNKMNYLNESWQWDEKDYLQWVNQHLLNYNNNNNNNNNNMIIQLNHITELRTGHYLVYLLESISGKSIKRTPSTEHHQPKDPLTNMQMLDFIVNSFKFMGREGVLVDGRYTIKDIFAGNESKIIEMLRTIKDWANQLHPSSVKKASGCTFGDNEEALLDTLEDN